MKNKKTLKKQFRYQAHCIFCGKIPLTKEEIYAEWIREYLSSTDKKTQYKVTINDGVEDIETYTTSKPGSPYVQKLKIVCAKCNNGWMSSIQGKTKPILKPLINGNPSILNNQDKLQIAKWVTMFTMVAEFKDKKTMAITQDERNQFMKTIQPLNGWHIFASEYQSEINFVGIHHRGFDLANTKTGYDTQVTSFTLGRIMITCISSTYPGFVEPFARQATGVLADLGFIRIWPLGSYHHFTPLIHDENLLVNIAPLITERWITNPDNNLYHLSTTY